MTDMMDAHVRTRPAARGAPRADAPAAAATAFSQLGQHSRFDQTRHIGRRPVTLSALAQSLRWHWKLVLGVMALVTLAGVTASFMIPPRYESIARIRITPNGVFASLNDDDREQPLDQSLVNTEIATIRSRDIARRVVFENGLQSDGEFVSAAQREGRSPALRARAVEAAITAVQARLGVEQQDKSYVIAIAFSSRDPVKAARIANSFAAGYIDNSADVLMSTAARQASSGQAALQRLSQQAEAAAASAAQYRAATGIEQGGAGGTVNDQQIAPLAMQLATAEAQAAAARSNAEAAQHQIASGGGDAISAVLTSTVIADLRRQRTEAEAQRAQYAARYGPKFPALVEANEQIAALDQQIRQEQGRILEGLKSEARAADAQAASLRGQLQALKGEIAQNNRAAVKADSLQRDADAATAAYSHLAGTVQQSAQAQRANQPQARLLEQAVVALHPSFPNRAAMAAASLLAGLVLGLAATLVSEGMRASLRSAEDVELLLGLKFLCSVPRLSRRQLVDDAGRGCSPADTLLSQPMSAYAEAFRAVRAAVRGHAGGAAQVLAISSTVPAEGKTSCSLTLARVMALSGERVLLVDGDLRRPQIARLAGVEVEHGLVELLLGKAGIDRVIVPDQVEGLSLLPASKPSFSPVDHFNSAAMRALLAELRGRFDYVIFDTPPLLGVADARTLAKLSDGVVLMIKWGETPVAAVDAALAGLEHDGAAIVGAVLTMVDPRSEAMGALYYSARYRDYYAA